MDYILSGKGVTWKRFGIIDPTFDSDHRLIVEKMNLIKRRKYSQYVKERKALDIDLFARNYRADIMLKELNKLSKNREKENKKR